MSCPSPSELQRFAASDVAAADRERLERHLSRCADCRQQTLGAFLAVEQQAETVRPAPPGLIARGEGLAGEPLAAQEPKSRSRARLWALAATVVLAAGLAWWAPRTGDSELGESRWRETTPTSRAAELLAPVGEAAVRRPDLELRWSEVDGADDYRVQILDPLGEVLFEQLYEGPPAIPPETLELPTGGTYFWRVTARLPGGTEADSTLGRFVIR